MTGVLASYLRRRVATHTIALTAMITGLLQVLELMEVTTDVLDRGLGLPGLVYYALLRAPGEIVLALPLAALLGAISSFHDLARNHEIIAHGEAYHNRTDCLRAVNLVRSTGVDTFVEELN